MRNHLHVFWAGVALLAWLVSGCAGRTPEVVAADPGPIVVAPPDPKVEQQGSAPSQAHVWVEGYWVYTNNRYVWIPGHWEVRPRTDAIWVPGYWSQKNEGWLWTPGYWK